MERKIYLDILRVMAVIGVITIHISCIPLFDASIFGQGIWWCANIFDSLSRWSVTIFIMISGALLINGKDELYSSFLKKRFSKVLIPFIFWSAFYFLYRIGFSYDKFTIKSIMISILQGGVYYHLWFMYAIMGIYLIVPILRKYVWAAKTKDLMYFIVLWLINVPIVQLINKVFHIKINFPIPMVGEAVGIFVLGYIIDKTNLSKKNRLILYISGIICAVMMTFGTFYLSRDGGIDEFLYVYYQLNNIIIACSIFVFIRTLFTQRQVENTRIKRLIISMSNSAFGIYLIHPFIKDLVTGENKIPYIFYRTPIGTIFTVAVIFIISYIIVMMIQKVKIINKIV